MSSRKKLIGALSSAAVMLCVTGLPALNGLTATASTTSNSATPVTITLGRANDPTIQFEKGQSWDNNDVYNGYLKDFGIKLKNAWVVDSAQYNTKVNLSISSGNIPDLMEVTSPVQLQQLVNAGLVANLTQAFNKYASPLAKKENFSNKAQMASATFNGQFMAIPFTDSPFNQTSWYLYIRQDWLNKLHLPAPTTMQKLIQDEKAFQKYNPGGAKTTYGIAADIASDGSTNNPSYGLTGFFNGYHAYPGIWVKNAQGKLVYGSTQPQVKTALMELQSMYKAGLLDPDFASKNELQENQLLANNQVGIAFGYNWLPSYPLINSAVQNGKVKQVWRAYPLPSVDGKPAMTQAGLGVDGWYVVNKNFKDLKAVMQLVNFAAQMNDNQKSIKDASIYQNGKSNNAKDYYWKLNPVTLYTPTLNLDVGHLVPIALQQKNPAILGNDQNALNYYQYDEQYLKGQTQFWNQWMKTKAGGSYQIMYQDYYKKGHYMPNYFYGAPTPTMTQDWSTLQTLENETFLQIITGKEPISAFDQFVKNWDAAGGTQITNEVNQWYASQSH